MSFSYAAALKSGTAPQAPTPAPTNKPTPQQHHQQKPPPPPQPNQTSPTHESNHRKRTRSTSPGYRAKTSSAEKQSYVLTFLTDLPHHQSLTSLRTKYFPSKLNHLSAHITLFHALPGSKLDSTIIPSLESLSATHRKFPINASTPMRLKRGIAISLSRNQGGESTRRIHRELQDEWREFLSEQDNGGFRPHYTIMNKVDDAAEVERAFGEVEKGWEGCRGEALGLSLWLYEGPGWAKVRDFEFVG